MNNMDAKEIQEYCDNHEEKCYANKLQPFMEELNNIKNKLETLNETVLLIPERLGEKFDKRYAGKTTEVAVYAVIGLITLTVIGTIINGIINQKNELSEADIIRIIDDNYSQK